MIDIRILLLQGALGQDVQNHGLMLMILSLLREEERKLT